MNKNTKPKFFYGYVIVLAAFFSMVVMLGTFYSFGIFFPSLLREFGWTRAATAGAYSLCYIFQGAVGVVMGRLNDKFGPRLVMTVSGATLGLGYLLMSQISAIWQLYLVYGVVVGIGVSGFVPLLSTVARWFVKLRGVMTGIVAAGIGVGTMIIPPVARWLISIYGWRTSYIIFGIIALVFIILAAQFLKRDPGQIGQLAYGQDELEEKDLDLQAKGLTLREAIRTGQFWMVSIIYFAFLFSLQSTIVHIPSHALELGVSAATAASIIAIIGGLSIIGKVLMGSASDRIGNRLALIIGLILLAISFLWLVVAEEVQMLYLFAVIFGFAYGSVAALESPLVAWLFGLGSHGMLLGVSNFIGTIGGSVGPFLFGRIFDIFGSYQIAFIVCVALGVAAVILALLIRPIYRQAGTNSLRT